MTNEEILVANALGAWNSNVARADKFFSALSSEQLQSEVGPGRNRLIYLFGHLTAISDGMLPLLGIGPRLHAELDERFLKSADKADAPMPSGDEIKKAWGEVNAALAKGLAAFTPADWLDRHAAVSAEDFAKEPLRNRFAILIGRTVHMGYHFGQVVLAPAE